MLRTRSLAISRRRYLFVAGGFLAGCMERVTKLEGRMTAVEGRTGVQETALAQLTDLNKRQWAKTNCTKEEVRDFLKACEQGANDQCSQTAVDGSMAFLDSQDHVTLYLRYDHGAYTINQLRKGLLLKQIGRNYLFPTTRFLIIVQPRGDEQAKLDEARRLGDEVIQYLRYELHLGANVPVLGPYVLPCKTKRNWINRYADYYDLPRGDEPKNKEERVRIWCFRTDC